MKKYIKATEELTGDAWDERFYEILREHGIDLTECAYESRIINYDRFGDDRRTERFIAKGDYMAVLAASGYYCGLQIATPYEFLGEEYFGGSPEEVWDKLPHSLEAAKQELMSGEEFEVVRIINKTTGEIVYDTWEDSWN